MITLILKNRYLWGEIVKKVIEKIKDILYDTFDYVIMLGIIVAVVAIIGWRLDVLFASDAGDIPRTEIHTAVGSGSESSNNEEPGEDTEKPDEENPGQEVAEGSDTEEEPQDVETPVEAEEPVVVPPVVEEPIETPPAQPTGEMVRIEIPAGSYPGKIGSILVEAGVIDNSKNFIAKAVELGKETRLKSGSYKIPKGSSYEDVIAILSK